VAILDVAILASLVTGVLANVVTQDEENPEKQAQAVVATVMKFLLLVATLTVLQVGTTVVGRATIIEITANQGRLRRFCLLVRGGMLLSIGFLVHFTVCIILLSKWKAPIWVVCLFLLTQLPPLAYMRCPDTSSGKGLYEVYCMGVIMSMMHAFVLQKYPNVLGHLFGDISPASFLEFPGFLVVALFFLETWDAIYYFLRFVRMQVLTTNDTLHRDDDDDDLTRPLLVECGGEHKALPLVQVVGIAVEKC